MAVKVEDEICEIIISILHNRRDDLLGGRERTTLLTTERFQLLKHAVIFLEHYLSDQYPTSDVDYRAIKARVVEKVTNLNYEFDVSKDTQKLIKDFCKAIDTALTSALFSDELSTIFSNYKIHGILVLINIATEEQFSVIMKNITHWQFFLTGEHFNNILDVIQRPERKAAFYQALAPRLIFMKELDLQEIVANFPAEEESLQRMGLLVLEALKYVAKHNNHQIDYLETVLNSIPMDKRLKVCFSTPVRNTFLEFLNSYYSSTTGPIFRWFPESTWSSLFAALSISLSVDSIVRLCQYVENPEQSFAIFSVLKIASYEDSWKDWFQLLKLFPKNSCRDVIQELAGVFIEKYLHSKQTLIEMLSLLSPTQQVSFLQRIKPSRNLLQETIDHYTFIAKLGTSIGAETFETEISKDELEQNIPDLTTLKNVVVMMESSNRWKFICCQAVKEILAALIKNIRDKKEIEDIAKLIPESQQVEFLDLVINILEQLKNPDEKKVTHSSIWQRPLDPVDLIAYFRQVAQRLKTNNYS